MRTSFHRQPEAQHPNFPLSTSWQADYPIYLFACRSKKLGFRSNELAWSSVGASCSDHGEAYEGGEDGRAWRSLVAPAPQSLPLIH